MDARSLKRIDIAQRQHHKEVSGEKISAFGLGGISEAWIICEPKITDAE